MSKRSAETVGRYLASKSDLRPLRVHSKEIVELSWAS